MVLGCRDVSGVRDDTAPTTAPAPTTAKRRRRHPHPHRLEGNHRQEPNAPPAAREAGHRSWRWTSDLDNLEPTFFKTDSAYYLVSNVYQSLLHEVYEPDADGLVRLGTNILRGWRRVLIPGRLMASVPPSRSARAMKFLQPQGRDGQELQDGMDRALLGPATWASLDGAGWGDRRNQVTVQDD